MKDEKEKTAINKYLASIQKILAHDFERIRLTHKDSDVKGNLNESLLQEFLDQHVSNTFSVRNVSIIDSQNLASDEIDICLCNQYQPFRNAIGQLVIAEGILVAVQVKAKLNGSETEKAFKNCQTIKRLQRKLLDNESHSPCYAGDKKRYIERIPYIVFAFESDFKDKNTTAKHIYNIAKNYNQDEWPDAFFILDQNFIVRNCASGQTIGGFIDQNNFWEGWVLVESNQEEEGFCLQELLRFIAYLPSAYRLAPLQSYLPDTVKGERLATYIEEAKVLSDGCRVCLLFRDKSQEEVDLTSYLQNQPELASLLQDPRKFATIKAKNGRLVWKKGKKLSELPIEPELLYDEKHKYKG